MWLLPVPMGDRWDVRLAAGHCSTVINHVWMDGAGPGLPVFVPKQLKKGNEQGAACDRVDKIDTVCVRETSS